MPPTPTAEFFCRHCTDDHGADALYLPGWSQQEWHALLEHARPVSLARGEVLMKAGQAERSLFLVASGTLEVNTGGGGAALGSLVREGPGAVIGEIAFFDGGARSATIWAIEPAQLFALQRPGLDAFAARHPARAHELLYALGRVLAFRVRRSEQRRRADAF